MKKSTKKLLVTVFCIITALCMFINVASACTMIYAGAATTAATSCSIIVRLAIIRQEKNMQAAMDSPGHLHMTVMVTPLSEMITGKE